METKRNSKREQDFMLVQRALCGQEAAYNEIWKMCYGYVEYQVKSVWGNDTHHRGVTVDDVVMEVFEKAFAALPTFTPEYRLSAWFTRIARNRALDYCRSSARHKIMRIDGGWNDESQPKPTYLKIVDDAPAPETILTKEYQMAVVGKYIGHLPKPYSDVLRMRHSGYDNAEIAEELGCTLRDVRHWLHRGEKKIRKMLCKEA